MFNLFSERAVLNDDVNESNVHTFLSLDTWATVSLCVAGSVGKQEFMPCAGGKSFSPCYHVERDLPYLLQYKAIWWRFCASFKGQGVRILASLYALGPKSQMKVVISRQFGRRISIIAIWRFHDYR